MSQATALLNSLSETVPTHAHPVIDSDHHYIVDPITRQVYNSKSAKNSVMQYDHNSERLTFEVPRYVEGHDMSLCNATKIHYINIDSEAGKEYADCCDVEDLKVNPDDMSTVICSWLIARQSTQLAGPLFFLVQFACTDAAGNVTYEWYTDINEDVTVNKGMNNGVPSVVEYTDILEQWRSKLFGAGDSVMEAIAAKGEETLATIPDDYTEVYRMADEAVRTKADAIVLKKEGEVIFVDDSSDDHVKNLKLYGKTTQASTTGAQLFDIHDTLVTRYCTIVDDTVEIDYDNTEGTTTAYANYYTNLSDKISESTDYLIVLEVISASGISRIHAVSLQDDVYKGQFSASHVVESPSVGTYVKVLKTVESFDGCASMCRGFAEILPGSVGKAKFRISVLADTSVTADTFKYEPYTGGVPSPNPDYPQDLVSVENPTVNIYGKNIANLSTHSGSANYVSLIDILDLSVVKKGKTYTLSIWLDSEVDSVCYWNNAAKVFSYLEFNVRAGLHRYTYTFVASEDGINYTSPVNVLNKYPTNDGKVITASNAQLEEGPDATEYASFGMQSLIATHTLPGIPVTSGGNYTDANGRQWICDEIDFERGVLIQRVGTRIFDGSTDEIWHDELDLENTTMFRIEIPDSVNVGNVAASDFMCDHFMVKQIYNGDSVGVQHTMRQFYFRLLNSTLNSIDLNGWKAWLTANPVKVQYILATPIETPLSESEIAPFRKLKTNYHCTTVLNDAGARMAIEYIADTTIYIRDHQPYISDERLQAAVDTWLEARYPVAEGVSF